ncbi:CPBP family intramembrane metalloprotease [Cellulophaga sp. 20_2_10]|uniref:CPBP family intramembrane glutamic endopeptidase n=1 Tax=Cellulophaga sp. 20_2_10 TaxID=2942476 RepID=UPI00201B04CA|nr:CPBP family intramembrane glutamic endopeptidase [Cellulophaga sp. 20_2_10]MCL5247740.1 CPBP family intramembrane metalloprotease [Cellulophaga sp. 20_2_10]
MANKSLKSVLSILAILTILSGIGYHYIKDTSMAIIYIAVFYMPTPLYALSIHSLITKENLVLKYIDFKKLNLKKIISPILMFLTWVIIILTLTFSLAHFFPEMFSNLITTNEELILKIQELAGENASSNANLPPSPLLIIPLAILSAIIAGFTINLIFGFTEEILWRGYLWDELKGLGLIKYSLLTGVIWGLWHAPLILQGYNYGNENLVFGTIAFIIFCTIFSFAFTILKVKTESTLLCGAFHGMFNAFAGVFTILLVNGNPFIDGAIGLTSIISIIFVVFLFSYLYKIKFKFI